MNVCKHEKIVCKYEEIVCKYLILLELLIPAFRGFCKTGVGKGHQSGRVRGNNNIRQRGGGGNQGKLLPLNEEDLVEKCKVVGNRKTIGVF